MGLEIESKIAKAVLDRIVDGEHGVLLIGDDEVELIVSVDQLPEGAGEGMCLEQSDDGEWKLLIEETQDRKAMILEKLNRLRERSSDV